MVIGDIVAMYVTTIYICVMCQLHAWCDVSRRRIQLEGTWINKELTLLSKNLRPSCRSLGSTQLQEHASPDRTQIIVFALQLSDILPQPQFSNFWITS